MNAIANTAAEKHAAQSAPAPQMNTLAARSSSCRSSRMVDGVGRRRILAFIPGPLRVGKPHAAFGAAARLKVSQEFPFLIE